MGIFWYRLAIDLN